MFADSCLGKYKPTCDSCDCSCYGSGAWVTNANKCYCGGNSYSESDCRAKNGECCAPGKIDINIFENISI